MQRQQIGNDSIILNYIRRYGPVSKALIARQTGITPPTVTHICNTLIKKGLIYEDRHERSALGRPSMLLRLCDDIETILIIHVRSHNIVFYVVDVKQVVKEHREIPISGLNSEEIMQSIYSGAADLIESGEYEIKSIGMVLRGPVDSEKGISIYSPNAKWSNIPFKYILEERFHIPVYMENDLRALTTGEYYFGNGMGAESSNMLMIKFSYGLGASLMYQGMLYRGFTDSAGEMGRMIVESDHRGQVTLESVCSETAIRNFVVEAVENGVESTIVNHPVVFEESFRVEPIYEEAVKGDKLCLDALSKVGYYLGVALANMTNLINPERIILSSAMGNAVGLMDPIIRNIIEANSYKTRPVELIYSGNGAHYTLLGMIDIVSAARAESAWLE